MKFKPILFGLTAAFMSLCAVRRPIPVKAGWNEFDDSGVSYGASTSAPDLSYSQDGVDYPASCLVTMPNGEVVDGDNLVYSMYGRYTFTYTVSVNGEIHSFTKTVDLPYPAFSVTSGGKSSVSYFSAEDASKYKAHTPGALVKLAYGETLSFTEPIALSELTSTNVLLKGYIVPTTEGTADVNQLIITLSDMNDPSIFVKERYYSHSQTSSITARSSAQATYAGYHDTQGLKINDSNGYGTWSCVSFIGANSADGYTNMEPDKSFFTVGYDNATKTVYGSKYKYGTEMDGQVLTLDSPALSSAFEGFKSDKVKMSVTCDGYSSNFANIIITDYLGKGAEAVKNNVYEDEEGPVVTLSEDASFPAGMVGHSYPVPEATAFDEISGACKVETRVVYNYANPDSSIDVAVVDGRFKMDRPGVYSIVYSARDYAGNVGKLVKSISVMEQIEAPDFNLPEHLDEVAIGSYLKLDNATNLHNGCGKLTQRIYVKHGEAEEEAVKGVRITEMVPYTITYEVSDSIGMVGKKSYTVNVVDGGKPILEDEVTYPRYLISNGGYYIPDSYAYYYDTGILKRENPVVTITDASGSKDYKPGDLYRPTVSKNGEEIEIKTSYNGVALQEDSVAGVTPFGKEGQANALNLDNYFVEENCVKVLEEGGMRIASKGEAAKVDFANAVSSLSSSLTLSQVQSMPSGGSLRISLTDSLEKNKAISATISYIDSSTFLEVNGVKKQLFNNNFNTTASSYPVVYENGSFSINDVSLPVTSYDSGEAFAGFDSERAYLSVEMLGQSGSSFLFESISQYAFSSSTIRDRIAPVIYSSNNLGGSLDFGSVYVIEPAFSFDVISPLVEFSMSVTAPNGDPAVDTNGVELTDIDPRQSHSLLLDQYGEYYFSIVSTEDGSFLSKTNRGGLTYIIRVYDDSCPSVSWTSTLPSVAKVGQSVLFPTFEMSDDVTPVEDLLVVRSISNPMGRTTYWYDDSYDGITFKYAGTYVFTVTVFDGANNCVSISQSIVVEE